MHQQKKKLSTLNPHLHIFIDRYMKVVTTVGGWWRKWEICVLILRNAHKSTFSHNVPCSNNVVCLWQNILFKLSPLQNGKFCSYHEFKKCKEFIIFNHLYHCIIWSFIVYIITIKAIYFKALDLLPFQKGNVILCSWYPVIWIVFLIVEYFCSFGCKS